ncbi:MAG: ribosomal RNA small subunit methyltransferase A [Verrucomicrobia bacterium]|nr:MAG: ribosomal RNA small subunit methyltransferase A [Verrucomicrobiota bacterium]PYK66352.1 MAG: ribosomal RNA small subunit methyltransferase A [Verrucomicrobiota bacterium]
MKLTEIRASLREIEVSPVKTLGQNFLHDQNLARWIVDQAEISPNDYVVEVGPGLGALTELLVQKCSHVLAIEKDTRLANFLRERFKHSRFEVINIDALNFDSRVLFSCRRVKLVGNIPYNISSALLLKFLQYPSPISLLLFMLQKEMALRLSASPRTQSYGSLTLHVQTNHHVKYLRTIPASVFFPKPEVDSALVKISPRDPLELPPHDYELLERLVRRGFSQRRKQLRKLLSPEIVHDWDSAASIVRFDPRARAEELSLPQWIALANYIAPRTAPNISATSEERFPVVDKNDRILRYAPRSEVHGNNLRHRAIHVLIFNQADEVYLQQRSRWKDRHPLKWDSSAAGHVGDGESYDEAAERELQEELGAKINLKRILKIPASTRTDHEFIWLYRGEILGGLQPNTTEIETGVFYPPAIIDGWVAARREDFAPGFLECWKAYRQKERSNANAPT